MGVIIRCICLVLVSVGFVRAVDAESPATWLDEINKTFDGREFQNVRLHAESVWRETQVVGENLRAGLAASHVGAALTMLGQFEDATQWQDRAEVALKTHGDVALLGRLEVARAVTAYLDGSKFGYGKYESALAHLDRAKGFLGAKDLSLQMVELEILGRSNEGEKVQAGYLGYQSLIHQFAQIGDSLQVARCAARLARLDGDTGGHGGALLGSSRAAEIFKAAGKTNEAALALRNVGHASRKMGDYADAESALNEALELAKKSSDLGVVVMVLNDLSRLHGEMEEQTQAVQVDREADRLMAEIGEGIRKRKIEDAVPLNYHHLMLLRFASLLPYETDLSVGFFDQLLLHP